MKDKRIEKRKKHLDKAALWMHSDTMWIKTATGLMHVMAKPRKPAEELIDVERKQKKL